MSAPVRVHEIPIPSRNGKTSEQVSLHDPLLPRWRQWLAMVKAPTTSPRWLVFLTNGALVATVIVGAISFGKSAGRTEAALANSSQVPEIQSSVSGLNKQMVEIKEMIKAQGESATKERVDQNREIAAIKQTQAALGDKVDALTNTSGSAWALSQSTSIKMGKLEGMLETMQRFQQQKDK